MLTPVVFNTHKVKCHETFWVGFSEILCLDSLVSSTHWNRSSNFLDLWLTFQGHIVVKKHNKQQSFSVGHRRWFQIIALQGHWWYSEFQAMRSLVPARYFTSFIVKKDLVAHYSLWLTLIVMQYVSSLRLKIIWNRKSYLYLGEKSLFCMHILVWQIRF